MSSGGCGDGHVPMSSGGCGDGHVPMSSGGCGTQCPNKGNRMHLSSRPQPPAP